MRSWPLHRPAILESVSNVDSGRGLGSGALRDRMQSRGWPLATDHGDAMRLLAENGVLDPALADRVRMAVGFRNLVIHEYARMDERIVLDRRADPSDLDLFVRAVSEWLER